MPPCSLVRAAHSFPSTTRLTFPAGDIDDPILDPELILPDLRWLIEFLSRVPEAFIRSGSNLLATLVGKVEARMTPENRAKRMRHRHDSLSERKVAREEPEQLPHKVRSPSC